MQTSGRTVATVLLLLLCAVVAVSALIEMPMGRFDVRKHVIETRYKGQAGPDAATGTVQVPLQGDEAKLGEYYISFTLGGQTFTAQVDTGSSDLAIPGLSCSSCGTHADPGYNPSKSSTSKVVPCSNPPAPLHCKSKFCISSSQCGYNISYGDGSGFKAAVYTDQLVISGYKGVTQAFGSIVAERKSAGGGAFEPFPTDGIMGFAYQNLSEINAPTPFDNLVASGQAANIFSFCLTNDGGTLGLGGILPYSTGSIQWTPIIAQLFYSVTTLEITFNDQPTGVSPKILNGGIGTVVDSGTTYLYIPTSALNAIKDIAMSMCETVNLVGVCNVTSGHTIFDGRCYVLTPAQVALYPPINITLGGNVNLLLSSQYYLMKGACLNSNAYSMAIGTQPKGIILGDTALKNYVTILDRQNKRVGFANVKNCPDGNAR